VKLYQAIGLSFFIHFLCFWAPQLGAERFFGGRRPLLAAKQQGISLSLISSHSSPHPPKVAERKKIARPAKLAKKIKAPDAKPVMVHDQTKMAANPVEEHTHEASFEEKGVKDGPTDTPGGGGHAADSAVAAYARSVATIINNHKVYPRLSRFNKEEGELVVKLVVDKNGKVYSSEVKVPTVHRRLNSAALETIEKIGNFPAPSFSSAQYVELLVPFKYQVLD
jgi:TonB family protein